MKELPNVGDRVKIKRSVHKEIYTVKAVSSRDHEDVVIESKERRTCKAHELLIRMKPKKKRREIWVNEYKGDMHVFPTKEEAEANDLPVYKRISCTRFIEAKDQKK